MQMQTEKVKWRICQGTNNLKAFGSHLPCHYATIYGGVAGDINDHDKDEEKKKRQN